MKLVTIENLMETIQVGKETFSRLRPKYPRICTLTDLKVHLLKV